MTAFSAIDLSKLPPPDFLAEIDFESELATAKAELVARYPEAANVIDLESEPLLKLLEVFSYRILIKSQQYNDETRSNLLAFALGSQLDHIGVTYFRTARLTIQEEDLDANPSIPLVMESDDDYRRRLTLAYEGYSTAGPVGAYIFHGLSADGDVKDIGVDSPNPGEVVISVLSRQGDGAASNDLLDQVNAKLSAEDVRPLTDQLHVQAAQIIPYQVQANLTLYYGPDAEMVRQKAIEAVQNYVSVNHAIGHDIAISGLHAALHQAGVQNVDLIGPNADLVVDDQSAAFCTQVTVNATGRNV